MSVIRFDGLLLRAFEDSDAAAFTVAARESIDSVGRWMPWCHAAYREDDALAWFATARAEVLADRAREFGVFSAETGEFMGGAGLNLISRQHRYCNLGYWVRESRQRQGVASRCVRALADHAFRSLDLMRVEIVVASGNEPSEGVARKSGALFECVARNRLSLDGVAVPASIFSLIPP